MKLAISNGKFTANGLQDIISWVEMAEMYKASAPKKDPDASPDYYKWLPIEGLLEQLVENEDGAADWNEQYWELGPNAFTATFEVAIKAWGGREIVNEKQIMYDGTEYWMTMEQLVLQ